MGLKECQIVLDNPWNTYYAGQILNGHVDFTFDKPKKIRGINIRFLGESNTKWTETESKTNSEGKSEEESLLLTGHEEYFQIQYYLVGSKTATDIELPAGTVSYPFTCTLPPTLPSSFEGAWGHVRYTIKVTLDRPWKFDQDSKMAFTVISPVDLNLNPRVKDPFKLDLEKSFCCFCCKSGPLSVIVTVPVTGFVSGQIIPIIAEVDNASNVTVEKLNFQLRKLVTFHTQTPRNVTKKESSVISDLSFGPIDGGSSRTWNQQLEIPPLPPSNLVNCGIIDLDYDLYVQAQVGGIYQNLDGVINLVIGTVPLSSFMSPTPYTDNPLNNPLKQLDDPSMLPTQPVSPASPPNGQGGALGWTISSSGQNMGGGDNSLYPNIPPPTFAETNAKYDIADKNDTEFTKFIGTQNYAPRYPTFQFNNPSAPAADL